MIKIEHRNFKERYIFHKGNTILKNTMRHYILRSIIYLFSRLHFLLSIQSWPEILDWALLNKPHPSTIS